MNTDSHSDEEITQILRMKKVAVIGMSKYEEKAAHFVPKYLLQNGFLMIKKRKNYHILFMEIDFYIIW